MTDWKHLTLNKLSMQLNECFEEAVERTLVHVFACGGYNSSLCFSLKTAQFAYNWTYYQQVFSTAMVACA